MAVTTTCILWLRFLLTLVTLQGSLTEDVVLEATTIINGAGLSSLATAVANLREYLEKNSPSLACPQF